MLALPRTQRYPDFYAMYQSEEWSAQKIRYEVSRVEGVGLFRLSTEEANVLQQVGAIACVACGAGRHCVYRRASGQGVGGGGSGF